MLRVKVFRQALEVLGDDGASVLVGEFGVSPSPRSTPEMIQLARKIHADFDTFHAYYKDQQDRAYRAEILSVVYGMG